jgi:transglutaminase/protease-like cytokinesis protein 3
MSDYEKERTIHDWMIEWAHYDIEANNQAPDARSNPENDNPYGLLIDREAICTGYAGTFQLFMDLLDIECLTVEGAAYLSTNDHAWNMVRLDGEWYCVDLTWNDPTLESDAEAWDYHMFFNVTSDYMRETEHIWDDEDTPEATGTAYGRSQPAG